jgi:serine/threonine-protein kinase
LLRDTTAQLSRLKGNGDTGFKFVAGKASDATEVLRASLSEENGKVILDAHLTEPKSGIDTKKWNAAYGAAETRFIPSALAGFVTETLHLPAAPVPAVNSAALADYTEGIRNTRRNSTIDAALPLLERAVIEDTDSPLTHAGLSEAQWFKYFITKDQVWLDRANQSLRLAEMRNPDAAPVHRIAGLLKENDGQYEEAVAEYQRAIEIEPTNSDAHRRLGQAYKANGQLDQAFTEFGRAVDLDRGYFKTYQDLGAFHFDKGDYSKAASQFQMAVKLAPDEPDAHHALGTAFSELGRYADAENEFHSALLLAEAPKTLINMAVALMYEEKYLEATGYLLRSLTLSPEWSDLVWLNLEMAYRRVNRTADSARANHQGLELAEKEISHDPRNGLVRATLAYFCARLGDRKRAESEIAQALQPLPKDAETLWVAAVTYEALGQRNDTLKILANSPDSVLADLSRWPDVTDLHKDSGFVQLLASRRIK